MRNIRYTRIQQYTLPPSARYGKAAMALYEMCTGTSISASDGSPALVSVPDTSMEAATKMMSLKELCALCALSIGDGDLGALHLDTYLPWPFCFYGGTAKRSFLATSFLNALFDHGYDEVRISPLSLLQLAARLSGERAQYEITDEAVILAACAFYSSFDERFQAIFYPSSYTLQLASDSASLFEFSSLLSQISRQVHPTHINLTTIWLGMLIQEPVPSLLFDFMSKTRQSTGIGARATSEDEVDASSMSEICHLYLEDALPQPADLSSIEFTDDVMGMVADSLDSFTPASTMRVVEQMMRYQDKGDIEVELWINYCKSVVLSCDFSDIPTIYYPEYVTLSASGEEALVDMLSDAKAPIREVLASSALLSFLDDTLAGGAPETSFLTREKIATGAKAKGYGDEELLGEGLSDDDLSILMSTRKLSHFGVPPLFQQAIIGKMIQRRDSMVSLDDIKEVTDPSSSEFLVLSGDVAPYSAHAGIEPEASRALAVAEAFMRRATRTLMLNRKSSLRLYASLLATAVSCQIAIPTQICSDEDQWMMSVSSASFDPRRHVFFALPEQGTSIVAQPTNVSVTFYAPNTTEGAQEAFNAQANPIPYLSAFGTDLVALAKEGEIGEGIVGRDETISLVETVLARRDKSNPLLLAPAGAGKSAVVEGIAAKMAKGDNGILQGYGLYQVDLGDIVAKGGSIPEITDRIESIVKEAIETQTILFIDEIHVMSSIGAGEMNIGNILKPYLARGGLKLIGATTEREYNYTIAKDRALARRFSALRLPSLPFDALMEIIKEKTEIYARHHEVKYDKEIARTTILLASEYMYDRESPDRELDIIDTAASVARKAGHSRVGEQDVVEAVRLLTSNRSVKTTKEIASEIYSGGYSEEELDEMFPNVAGQYGAKESVARRIAESKLDISARRKPKSVFMFVGKSGVGKTLLAHEMASLLDADEADILTLNLSEYKDEAAHTRLLGASPQYVGYQEGGVLTNFAKAHPHGIVVLDEIDKSHPSIQQVFLGAFDTGEIRAADGSIADCHSLTFVCTANTGFDAAKKNALGFSTSEGAEEQERQNVRDALKDVFGEPLLGRIDEIVVFGELSDEDYVDMCLISYRHLADKLSQRHAVDLSKVYTEDDLRRDVEDKLAEKKSTSARDARSVWAEIEKEIVPKAMKLLAG